MTCPLLVYAARSPARSFAACVSATSIVPPASDSVQGIRRDARRFCTDSPPLLVKKRAPLRATYDAIAPQGFYPPPGDEGIVLARRLTLP